MSSLPTTTPPRAAAPLGTADFTAALGVVVIWGLNFVAMKIALRDFTPFQLGVARYVAAVLPIALFVRPPRLPARWVIAAGLCQFGQFALLFVALRLGMTAALASVLMQTQLFFTTLAGALLLHERLSGATRGALALAAAGLACFGASVAGAASGGVTWLALLLNLGGAASWAASNIVTRRAQQAHPGYDALQFVVWMSAVPILPFAALAWWAEPEATRWHWLQAGTSTWLAIAYLGWCATIGGYALWTGLFKRHPASRVAPFSLGVPVVGLAAGMLALGETVTPWQWLGSACVVAALGLTLLRRG